MKPNNSITRYQPWNQIQRELFVPKRVDNIHLTPTSENWNTPNSLGLKLTYDSPGCNEYILDKLVGVKCDRQHHIGQTCESKAN